MLKYIFLGLLYSFFNSFPISLTGHLILYRHIFNTEIFNTLNISFLINIGIIISLLFILRKTIFNAFKKENRKKTLKLIKKTFFLIPVFIIISLNIFKSFPPLLLSFFFLINAFILFKIKFNNQYNSILTNKSIMLIGGLGLLTIFPGISLITMLIFGLYLAKIKKEKILKHTLFFYLIYLLIYLPINFPNFIINFEEYLTIHYLICIFSAIVASFLGLKLLNKLIIQNKLKNISIYLFILAAFILLYFR